MADPKPFNFKGAITEMVQRTGSDLHLKVGRPPTIRVSGDLEPLDQAALKPEDLKALAEQIMTPRQVKEFAGSTRRRTSRSACRASAGSGPTCISSAARWRSCSGPFPTRSRTSMI